MNSPRQRLGDAGERYAERVLVEKGWRVLDRKWRGSAGEVDLVAETEPGGSLVFVEVKTRRGRVRGAAEEAISGAQSERLIALGDEYVAADPDLWDRSWRIDLIAITIGWDGRITRVTHIVNACEQV